MSSRFPKAALLLIAPMLAGAQARPVLRVCADPNNLPFSNQRQEGFENRIAEVMARDLGAKLEYTWWSERKSFLKNSLDAGKCDAVMGVPAMLDSVAVTRPYYRSTYVFVTRRDRKLSVTSLDDPRMEQWRIGIHVLDDDYAPPAHALARRGLGKNIVGYSMFGAYGEENPPARIIDAVARGDIDLAIVWGPFAGYFAKQEKTALDIQPVSPTMFLAVPFTYDISIGVRKGDEALRAALDRALSRNCAAVRSILADYGVPLAASGEGETLCAASPQSPASSH